MLHPPRFYYVKKTREVAFWTFIRRWNHKPLGFFDIIIPKRIEHLQKEEPFSSDPYFRNQNGRYAGNWCTTKCKIESKNILIFIQVGICNCKAIPLNQNNIWYWGQDCILQAFLPSTLKVKSGLCQLDTFKFRRQSVRLWNFKDGGS